MTLTIFEILPLEIPRSRMEVIISPRLRLASATRWLMAVMNSAACCEFSAFLRVIDANSSLEEEVSSRDAACSDRSEEHTSELQSRFDLVCRLLLEKKKKKRHHTPTMVDKLLSVSS